MCNVNREANGAVHRLVKEALYKRGNPHYIIDLVTHDEHNKFNFLIDCMIELKINKLGGVFYKKKMW